MGIIFFNNFNLDETKSMEMREYTRFKGGGGGGEMNGKIK